MQWLRTKVKATPDATREDEEDEDEEDEEDEDEEDQEDQDEEDEEDEEHDQQQRDAGKERPAARPSAHQVSMAKGKGAARGDNDNESNSANESGNGGDESGNDGEDDAPPVAAGSQATATAGHNGGQAYYTVRVLGLPFKAREKEIVEFFMPVRPIDVRLLLDPKRRSSGRAFVDFATKQDYKAALTKHMAKMGNSPCQPRRPAFLVGSPTLCGWVGCSQRSATLK
jgi:RNA recognition motif-containing protein